MKSIIKKPDITEEFVYLKNKIDVLERNLDFVKEPKLIDAINFELLGLRSKLGYILDVARGE